MSKEHELIQGDELCRTLLDAVPLPVFVVDEDVQIWDLNVAAAKMLNGESQTVFRRRGGDVLHCIHSTESPEGCGRGEACTDCIVRNSVKAAFEGQTLFRQKARMELVSPKAVKEVQLFVTTTPFEYKGRRLVLLVIEDISELLALRSLLPICAKCKKIRDDKDYWHKLESYLTANLNVDLTHGLCPDCMEELYPAEMRTMREQGLLGRKAKPSA